MLALLYLRGLSTNDFAPRCRPSSGSHAGLSGSPVQRLTEAWRAERERWAARGLHDRDYLDLWADGVHVPVRLPNPDTKRADPLCLLVTAGVRLDDTKELVAVAAGYRESTESGPRCCATCATAGNGASGISLDAYQRARQPARRPNTGAFPLEDEHARGAG